MAGLWIDLHVICWYMICDCDSLFQLLRGLCGLLNKLHVISSSLILYCDHSL